MYDDFSFSISLTALFILFIAVHCWQRGPQTIVLALQIIKTFWTYLNAVFWQLNRKMRIEPKSSASSLSYPFSTFFAEHYRILSSRFLSSGNALTHQRGHVSSVHLPCGDLLLRRGHSAHIERVGAADGPRPNYTWKCNRAVLHAAHPVKLLLQNCGSETGKKNGCSIRKVQRCNQTCDLWHIIFYPYQISNKLLYFKWIVCVCKKDIILCKLTHGGVLAMTLFSCSTRVCTFKCW